MSIAQDSYLGPRLSALLKAFTPGLGEEPDAAPHSWAFQEASSQSESVDAQNGW